MRRCALSSYGHQRPLTLRRVWAPRASIKFSISARLRLSQDPTIARFNEIGVQQLSSHIFPQVFPGLARKAPPELVALSRDHLARHDLLGKNADQSPPISLDLPKLRGKSLDEHFYKLGRAASEPYLSLATEFAETNLPEQPKRWIRKSGWIKYYHDGRTESVLAPDEQMLSFDVEVMWKNNPFAVMACAASPTAWYAWLSPWLLGETEQQHQLVPLGDREVPRIVVGHNVGYDRARVAEEYDIRQSKNFFLDTMSLHVAVNGMCSIQRSAWQKHRKSKDMREKVSSETNSQELANLLENNKVRPEEADLWMDRSSINSLRDVAKFHCDIELDKAKRDFFSETEREVVLANLDDLLTYCASDVAVTQRIFKKVMPGFLQVCPHPVSFGALRHLSSVILPVNRSWDEYIKSAEETYQQRTKDVELRLQDLANKALEIKEKPDIFEKDPWLSQLDWSGQEIRMVKGKKKGDPPRPAARQKLPGMPAWYRDLFPSSTAPIKLTVRTRIAPLLLRLSWDGHPLVWSEKHGWVFRIDAGQEEQYKDKRQCDMSNDKDPKLRNDHEHSYFKLPHKDGPDARCINPLAKGYLQYFEKDSKSEAGKRVKKDVLSSEYPTARKALEMNASCSYWISARDRIMSQMVVYDRRPETAQERGFILPQIIPMGTITRRAVENTWLTASNAKANRVGSELKSMVKAPPGYSFVGADVDSQELWIASLVGDAQFKIHGGNALGFMTLEGTKATGTDLHSKTAEILKISRNDAKVFNYGRIYGAGQTFAATLLRQFDPRLSEQETMATALQLYRVTKGIKTSRKAIAPESFWRGGRESFVFNMLETFADQERPRTPVLGAGITEALMRKYLTKGEFMTSRINWAIQSSGVDYLHLLIISMDYLIAQYNLEARLAITVHDEIRYLVANKDKYKAAMALQVANIWTRAMFSQQMGIDDLPQSCAFFSAVDIDHVLRKEVDMDCVTPSHPEKIPHGESLNIDQLVAKGDEASLDDATEPLKPFDLDYDYTPREPIMAQMQSGLTSKDLTYLKAQVISDDKELRALIAEVSGMPTISKRAPRQPRMAKPPAQKADKNFSEDEVLKNALLSKERVVSIVDGPDANVNEFGVVFQRNGWKVKGVSRPETL